MSALALLSDLASKGVRVAADGGRLTLDAPKGVLTPDLTERLRAEKPALLAALGSRPRCVECRRPIIEEVTTWLGGEPSHYDCGLRAWEREWRPRSRHADEHAA